MTIATINPTTGKTLKSFEPYDEAEVERRLELADSAFRSYRRTSFEERASLVRRMADVLEGNQVELQETLTLEMGKPLVQARAEVTKCIGVLRYYAEHGAATLADEPVAGTARKARRVPQVPADRPSAGSDALELPTLAGH